jgi:hypothetical protein
MPKDTQTSARSTCDEKILAVLQMADERMLSDSGNPVYLQMKAELELLQ